MANNKLVYSARFYMKNPGGAYDPAPMNEFDIDGVDHPPTIAPGDTICAWANTTGDPRGQVNYYKVINRTFRFDPDEIFVFFLIENIEENWTREFS